MQPSIPTLILTSIVSAVFQDSWASHAETATPIDGTSGVWRDGVFYEDSDEDLYIDEDIQTIRKLKRENPCITSSNSIGTCMRRDSCGEKVRTLSEETPHNLCLIGGMHVGICCPKEFPPAPASQETITSTLQTPQGPRMATGRSNSEPPKKLRGCGLSPDVITGADGRIIGVWTESKEGRWPWIVALMKNNGKKHFCGGTLIDNRHVLTAAHCLEDKKAKDVSVRLGEFHLDEPSETEISIKVAEIIVHEDYQSTTYKNDIAILVLKKKVKFNQGVISPACLPKVTPSDVEIEENDPLANRTAITKGWGRIYYGGPASPVLLEVEVPIWKIKHCNDTYTQVIGPTVICAGEEKGGKDSCAGDSGGPLVIKESGRWQVIGIVSWGIGCGEPNAPGVYTRVSKYIDWILEKTAI